MNEDSDKKKKNNTKLIIGFSIFITLSIGLGIGYGIYVTETPTLVEVHVEFYNGTKKWIHQEDMEELKDQIKPNYEDFMTKVTDLRDGTVDYRFKHIDAIGAKPKVP